jgi:formate dehydrogenase major subunit
MGIVFRKEDQLKKQQSKNTVLFGQANGQPKPTLAFINDEPFEIIPGETVLSFIRRFKGEDAVPTLCDAPNLEPFGSCRVCSVDIALTEHGKTKAVASCHTPVIPGSYIYPDSEKIQRLRKNIIELVLTDHPLDCRCCKSWHP